MAKKGNLLIGVFAIIVIVVLAMLMGYWAIKPEPVLIVGEAEATEYRVSSMVPARLSQFNYEEGDMVKAGDTLVLLSSPQVEAKKAQATAAQAAASAQNQKAINGARKEQIQGAKNMYEKAMVGVDICQKSLSRVQALYDKGVVTAQKRDEVQAQYDAAIATANAAKSQYDMALAGAQAEDKAAARALVERAAGAVQEVNSYLDETILCSPIDGEVAERFPKVGELVGQGAPIMTILDLKDIWFTFSVREDMLLGMTVGSEVDVKIPALGEQTYKAKISYIRSMASYATWRATKMNGEYDVKSFAVKARPVQPIKGLRPGMTAILVQEKDSKVMQEIKERKQN